MNPPRLKGIVPPLPTPLLADESLDAASLAGLIEAQIGAGVHGLWVLGTTGRFDLLTDGVKREAAEVASAAAGGRVPLVLNVSEQGTARTRANAARFDDLPFDYYAALPPWYQPMTPGEVSDYFLGLADTLARPLVIYNAPWICNQLGFPLLRKLAEHPRIVGCKDVTPVITRALDWPAPERRDLNFRYLHGSDQIALMADLGADGFVSALSNALPEVAVGAWEATVSGDEARAFRLQSQFLRVARVTGFGPMLACLEVLLRHRGFLDRMLPSPLRPLDAAAARRVVEAAEAVGLVPEPAGSAV